MTRPDRPRSVTGGRQPGRRPWRFICLVATVASTAFYVTLNAPHAGLPQPAGFLPFADEGHQAINHRGSLSCTVAYINDGDTLRCQDGTRIRLHAVSARERDGSCSPGHPCPSATAAAATAQLSRLAGGKTIHCEPTGHSYNRVTAICWTPEGEEINCAMVQSGVALLWDRFNRQRPLCRHA